MSLKGQDLVRAALLELNLCDPVDPVNAEDAQFVLDKLNRILDRWNASRSATYNTGFATYTLVPSLQPHTIGPTGATFTVTQRPVSIEAAKLVLNTVSPAVSIPLDLWSDQQWSRESVKTLTSPVPVALYYSPDWPNGSLYLWPIPTVAYQLELMTRFVLAVMDLQTTTFTLPPGYWDALILTTAEQIAEPFEQPMPATLPMRAAQARAQIFTNNDQAPPVMSVDGGMPGGHDRETFNVYSRTWAP